MNFKFTPVARRLSLLCAKNKRQITHQPQVQNKPYLRIQSANKFKNGNYNQMVQRPTDGRLNVTFFSTCWNLRTLQKRGYKTQMEKGNFWNIGIGCCIVGDELPDLIRLVLKLITALKQICNHPKQFLKKGKVLPILSGKSYMEEYLEKGVTKW